MHRVFIFGGGYNGNANVVELQPGENIDTSEVFRDAVTEYMAEYGLNLEEVEIVISTGESLRLGLTIVDRPRV